jgi:type II secretory pathway pseudopilin PulG
MTLIELLSVVAIVALLSAIAIVQVEQARVRAKVSSSKSQLRTMSGAIEAYRTDYGRYPSPVPSSADDPFGVVASSAIRGLTTPIAYMGVDGFIDPFGDVRLQMPSAPPMTGFQQDPFAPPRPGFNSRRSLLYFYYPVFGRLVARAEMAVEGYAVVSLGPDLKDSFIAYFPFPDSLPASAAAFGIRSHQDAVYDPTNGASSGGDLAAFGGGAPAPSLVGGGRP